MEESEESSRESEDGISARRHAIADARRTQDDLLSSTNSLSKKCWRVLQFNGIIATVLVAVVPGRIEMFENNIIGFSFFLIGAGILIISTLFGLDLLSPKGRDSGIGPEEYKKVSKYDYKEDVYLEFALHDYGEMIEETMELNEEYAQKLMNLFIMSMAGIGLLASGILITIAQ